MADPARHPDSRPMTVEQRAWRRTASLAAAAFVVGVAVLLLLPACGSTHRTAAGPFLLTPDATHVVVEDWYDRPIFNLQSSLKAVPTREHAFLLTWRNVNGQPSGIATVQPLPPLTTTLPFTMPELIKGDGAPLVITRVYDEKARLYRCGSRSSADAPGWRTFDVSGWLDYNSKDRDCRWWLSWRAGDPPIGPDLIDKTNGRNRLTSALREGLQQFLKMHRWCLLASDGLCVLAWDAGRACEAYSWETGRVARLAWADAAEVVSANGDLDHLRLIVRGHEDGERKLIDRDGTVVCTFRVEPLLFIEHTDWQREQTSQLITDQNAPLHDHATLRAVAWRTGAVTSTPIAIPTSFTP